MKRAALEKKVIRRQKKLCRSLDAPEKNGRSRKYKPFSCGCAMCSPAKRKPTKQELFADGGADA